MVQHQRHHQVTQHHKKAPAATPSATAATAPPPKPTTTPLTPAPPAFPPPTAGQAPWGATGTAQLAATRSELNDALQEFSELRSENQEQEA